ncbi:MAG: phage tail tape measure protein [Oscillospiraceae bacterium]
MALEVFKLFGSIFVDNTSANNSISKTKNEASSLWDSFKNGISTVGEWASSLASATLSVGKEFVSLATDAEVAFAKTQTLLSSDTDTKAYYNDILKLSKETGVAFSELTEATYSAISASVDQANAVDFVNKMNKLAVGGFTDVAKATDVVTTAINAYGLSAGEATNISDKLITTQNLGKTSVDELAANMGNVIPTANSVGVNLDNLCATYAQLTAGGMNTASTTTNINAMLLELGTTGTKVDTILREQTGKSFKELMDSGQSLGDVIVTLNDYATSTGQSFGDIWSSSNAGAAAKAMISNIDVFNSDLKAMGESSGATETAFETMSNTMSYQLQRLTTLLDDTKIELGNALLPTVREFVDFITNNLPNILKYVEDFIPILVIIVEDIGTSLMEVATSILPILFDTINELVPIVTDILSAIAPSITDLINTILPTLLNLIQLLLPYIIDIIEYVSSYVEPLGNVIQSIVEFLMPIIDEILPILIEDITKFINILMGFLSSTGEDLSSMISNVLEVIIKIGSIAGGELLNILERLIQNIPYSLITSIVGIFTDIINNILPVIITLITSIIDILDSVYLIFESLLNPLADLINLVGSLISEILPVVVDLINQLLPVILQVVDMVLPMILNLVSNITPILSQLVIDILPLIVDLISELSPVISILIEAIQPILGVINELLPYIENIIYTLLPILSGLIYGIVSTIDTVLKPVLEVLAGTIRDGVALAIQDLSPLIDGVKIAMNGIVDFINNVFSGNWSGAWQNIVDIFDSIFSGIGDSLKNIINTLIDGINYLINGVNSLSDNFGEISIPDWLGGGTIGFPKIPEIPQLAEGGIAYGNSIVNVAEYQGVNTNPEVIAPLDKLQNIISTGDNSETNAKLDTIIVMLGYILNKIDDNRGETQSRDLNQLYSDLKDVEKKIDTAKGV